MAIKVTQVMNEKNMVMEMISRVSGGDSRLKELFGMSDSQYNNRKYQTQNQRFRLEHLMIIQELSESTLLSQYCAPEGYVLVKKPDAEKLDKVELATVIVMENGAHGDLESVIRDSLRDEVLTPDEIQKIEQAKNDYISLMETKFSALKALFSEQ